MTSTGSSAPMALATGLLDRRGKRKADEDVDFMAPILSDGNSGHTSKRPKLNPKVRDTQTNATSRPTKDARRRARVNMTPAAAEELEAPEGDVTVEKSSTSSAAALNVSQNDRDATIAPMQNLQKPRKSRSKNQDANPPGAPAPDDGIDQPMLDAPPHPALLTLSAGVAATNDTPSTAQISATPIVKSSAGNVSLANPRKSQSAANQHNPAATISANIGKVFIKALPPKKSPWPLTYPQAHTTYDKDMPCPIDWSQLPDLTAEKIRAYENRAPWNKEARPWAEVVAMDTAITGKTLAVEGIRKRFRATNVAVYKATAVYFYGSSIGLEGFGIPTDITLRQEYKAAKSGQGIQSVTKTISQSHPDMFTDKDLLHTGSTVMLILQSPNGAGPVIRYISKAILARLRISANDTIQCSSAAFDRWYSSVCFGLRHTLPKRVYKLRQLPKGSTHEDEGKPPVNIHGLIETYCLSQLLGTPDVSDLLLDELWQILEKEPGLAAQYKDGAIWDHNDEDLVRFMDLDPEDVEDIWGNTEINDPIRQLISDVLNHVLDDAGTTKQRPGKSIRDGWQARQQYSRLTHFPNRESLMQGFVDSISPEDFCVRYHNHEHDDTCYRALPASARSKRVIDETLDESDNKVTTEIAGVDSCRVVNESGDPSLSFAALQRQYPEWDWDRVRAVQTYITIPKAGPQIREIRPDYYPEDSRDSKGRYPSHPGHNRANWVDPDLDGQNSYEKKWTTVMREKEHIPDGAQRIRKDVDLGAWLFDVEEKYWYPPDTFPSDVERLPDQTFWEWQNYRTWLWKEQGGKVPMVTCKRFLPFEEDAV